MNSSLVLQSFLDDIAFPESPRWHEGELWFSDFYTHRVRRVDAFGRVTTVAEVPGQPSGLGWRPDGQLLIVSMTDRQLLRHDGKRLHLVADLSDLAPFHCNDMVVDTQGRAYIGNLGFDLGARAPFKPTNLIMVSPDGQARVVAEDMHFPNGTVITPDGKTLIIGESYGARLTAFDIAEDGSLSRRRTWAQLKGATPDGICMDAEGAIWVASPISREVLRVRAGGEVTHRVPTEGQAVACMLGGMERRTLYVLTGKVMTTPEQSRAAMSGRILTVEVAVPGVGLP